MSTKEFKMHHASSHAFDFPDYDLLCANTTNHENGLLGLWVAGASDWIQGFGGNVYALEFEGVTLDLPIEELSKWAKENRDDPLFYVGVRNGLLSRGIDYVHVIESNGTSAMGIVINFQAIKTFSLIKEAQPVLLVAVTGEEQQASFCPTADADGLEM